MLHLNALGENCSLAVPASVGLWFSLTCKQLESNLCVHLHMISFSVCMSESESPSPFSSIKTLVIGFRTHPKPV